MALTLLANAEDLLLGFVDDVRNRAAFRVEGIGGNLVARRQKLTQNRSVAHDFGVAPNIGGTRHILG